jgi:hypothetical protein
MIYLLQTDDGITYPFVKEQLRSTFPNVSFPFPISDECAASHGCFPVQTIDRPDHDPRTQRIEEPLPEQLEDGTWRQVLTVRAATDEEIEAYDEANRPAPDWAGFRQALLTNDVIDDALQGLAGVPGAMLALPTALQSAATGDPAFLCECLQRLSDREVLAPEVREQLAEAAAASNLPAEVTDLFQQP